MALLGVLLTGVTAILLALAPLGIDADAWRGPHPLLIVLGFWAARRPEATPPALVFALGLAYETLRAGPIGAETFALLITIEILRLVNDRSPARVFAVEWLRLALAALLFEAIILALFALTLKSAPEAASILERYAMTLLLYPPAVWLLQRLSRVTRRPPAVY